jgi:hypothetical protein
MSSHGAATMPTPSTWRQGLVQCLCFLLPCWHRRWASSRFAPSGLGARSHQALACPYTSCGHSRTLPVQLTILTLAYGQNSHPTRALHDTRCHCASTPCEHMPALPLYHHAELSHLLHARATTRAVLSNLRLRGYIGPPPPCILSTLRRLLAHR